jgi:hypothetical protein
MGTESQHLTHQHAAAMMLVVHPERALEDRALAHLDGNWCRNITQPVPSERFYAQTCTVRADGLKIRFVVDVGRVRGAPAKRPAARDENDVHEPPKRQHRREVPAPVGPTASAPDLGGGLSQVLANAALSVPLPVAIGSPVHAQSDRGGDGAEDGRPPLPLGDRYVLYSEFEHAIQGVRDEIQELRRDVRDDIQQVSRDLLKSFSVLADLVKAIMPANLRRPAAL